MLSSTTFDNCSASLHLVVSLNSARLSQTENKRFEKLKCEIQVRTILQHAWAEIEHDLGYKSGIVIPEPISRNFAQLAASLESADEQFLRIRSELAAYAAKAREDTEIESGKSALKLDATTIVLFADKNNQFKEIEKRIRPCWKEATAERRSVDFLQQNTAFLLQLGIKSIADLAAALTRLGDKIIAFSEQKSKDIKDKVYPVGWSLMQLAQILPVDMGDPNARDWIKKVVRSRYKASEGDIDSRHEAIRSIVGKK